MFLAYQVAEFRSMLHLHHSTPTPPTLLKQSPLQLSSYSLLITAARSPLTTQRISNPSGLTITKLSCVFLGTTISPGGNFPSGQLTSNAHAKLPQAVRSSWRVRVAPWQTRRPHPKVVNFWIEGYSASGSRNVVGYVGESQRSGLKVAGEG